jgi:hypothetical protein
MLGGDYGMIVGLKPRLADRRPEVIKWHSAVYDPKNLEKPGGAFASGKSDILVEKERK